MLRFSAQNCAIVSPTTLVVYCLPAFDHVRFLSFALCSVRNVAIPCNNCLLCKVQQC